MPWERFPLTQNCLLYTSLQELQAQADTLADLLEIESSLSDVQYQIEIGQSQLDWYSNQVSCCTVYITLNEVETLSLIHIYTTSEMPDWMMALAHSLQGKRVT